MHDHRSVKDGRVQNETGVLPLSLLLSLQSFTYLTAVMDGYQQLEVLFFHDKIST